MSEDSPSLTSGALAVDDRGAVGFVNAFNPSSYRRFYVVRNHASGFVRAWHGHRFESKAVTVLSGTALVCAVKPDDWDSPSPNLNVSRFVLSESAPGILEIPAGWANGFMTLLPETRLLFFSSASLEESKTDDIRFDARLWDPWRVEER